MNTNSRFIDDYINGLVLLEDIDNYVDYWHNHNTNCSLREYLGFTVVEFNAWCDFDNDSDVVLENIITARELNMTYEEYINEFYDGSELKKYEEINIEY